MILVVDNHGFTTRILAHQLGGVHIVTAAELSALRLDDYTHVVVTHGPDDSDLAPLKAVPHLPVLAIGAGYQQLGLLYGHVETAPVQPIYGQPVPHHHDATGIFAELPDPVSLISYHAWRLNAVDPHVFSIAAADDDGAVVAFRVHGTQHWGLHADPAALQSQAGTKLIENFLALSSEQPPREKPTDPTTPRRSSYELHTRQIRGELDTAATFAQLQQDTSAAFWLDSASAHLGQGDVTLMGTSSGALAQVIRWNVDTNRLDIQTGETTSQHTVNVLDYISENAWETAESLAMPGFTGGWVGYFGYEAKQATVDGHQNRWAASTPDAYWIRPQAFISYDHRCEITTLFAYHDEALLDALEATLAWGSTAPPEPAEAKDIVGQWRMSANHYEQRVTQIQKLLHAGTAAGVCLTDIFAMQDHQLDGFELYLRLRTNNPAPYAGYLRFNTFDDDLEILSASPEKYLSIDAAGWIESKPIKGTVARSQDPELDATVAARMAADPKFQSENLMITDLLRDDLATVTVAGTVQVPKLMTVESFATVHQLVTTVTGQLLPEVSAPEALKAVFPGGSMTGAPKLASLEILDDLEAGPRGIYSGAIGWIGDDNTAELSVVIRSIILEDGALTIGAGGAVVVGSDPAAEEQEKRLKAQAQMRSIAEQL